MKLSGRIFVAGLGLAPLMGAIALANAGTLTINGSACGAYNQLTVDASGNISVTGVAGSCTINGGNTGGDGGNTGGDGGNTGGGGGDEPHPDGVVTNEFGKTYVETITLRPAIPNTNRSASNNDHQMYSFKFAPDSYTSGTFSTVSYYGVTYRTMVISDAPGKMTAPSGSTGACTTRVQAENTLRWQIGAGTGCALQAGKTYYLNVKPYQACTTANTNNCSFTLSGQAR